MVRGFRCGQGAGESNKTGVGNSNAVSASRVSSNGCEGPRAKRGLEKRYVEKQVLMSAPRPKMERAMDRGCTFTERPEK
jgi:hypothetical protein